MENNQKFDFSALPIAVQYVAEVVKENDWHCDQWRVTIGEGKTQFTTDYFTGLGHRKVKKSAWRAPVGVSKQSIAYKNWERQNLVPVKPDNKSIMHSLLLDSEATDYCFNDWAETFGFSSDSISASNTYQQCCDIGQKLRKVFLHEQIKQMREALENY